MNWKETLTLGKAPGSIDQGARARRIKAELTLDKDEATT
jgi:hypothetical protein